MALKRCFGLDFMVYIGANWGSFGVELGLWKADRYGLHYQGIGQKNGQNLVQF